jgi:hypothetical protein
MMTEAEAFLTAKGIDLASMNGYNYWSPSPLNDKLFMQTQIRSEHIARFGFAVLTQQTVDAIVKHAPLLEIGCGSGYWSYELRKAGVDVVATDPGIGKYYDMSGWKPFIDIELIDGVTAVRKYPNRALLIVWPDYDTPWSFETLQTFEGTTVIYVGEGNGGCTANDEFHELLSTHYEQHEEIAIPQFWGLHDRLEVYKRKGELHANVHS